MPKRPKKSQYWKIQSNTISDVEAEDTQWVRHLLCKRDHQNQISSTLKTLDGHGSLPVTPAPCRQRQKDP